MVYNGKDVQVYADGNPVSDTNPFPVGTKTGLVKVAYDYFVRTLPSATQELYTFKVGGSGGTTVATVTLNYSDSSLNTILNGTYSEV